jgi:hypothetical protein
MDISTYAITFVIFVVELIKIAVSSYLGDFIYQKVMLLHLHKEIQLCNHPNHILSTQLMKTLKVIVMTTDVTGKQKNLVVEIGMKRRKKRDFEKLQ